jgi:hypothetical protein
MARCSNERVGTGGLRGDPAGPGVDFRWQILGVFGPLQKKNFSIVRKTRFFGSFLKPLEKPGLSQ